MGVSPTHSVEPAVSASTRTNRCLFRTAGALLVVVVALGVGLVVSDPASSDAARVQAILDEVVDERRSVDSCVASFSTHRRDSGRTLVVRFAQVPGPNNAISVLAEVEARMVEEGIDRDAMQLEGGPPFNDLSCGYEADSE